MLRGSIAHHHWSARPEIVAFLRIPVNRLSHSVRLGDRAARGLVDHRDLEFRASAFTVPASGRFFCPSSIHDSFVWRTARSGRHEACARRADVSGRSPQRCPDPCPFDALRPRSPYLRAEPARRFRRVPSAAVPCRRDYRGAVRRGRSWPRPLRRPWLRLASVCENRSHRPASLGLDPAVPSFGRGFFLPLFQGTVGRASFS